jgi:hypothetical protein
VTSGNLNSRIKNLVAGEPDWKKPIEYSYKGKRVLEMPISLTVKNLFAQGNGDMKKNAGEYRILLFQTTEAQFRPYLFKIENGEDSFELKNKDLKHLNLKQIPNDSTGKYIFFNLDGGFVGSWNIASGERMRAVSYLKPAETKIDQSNARITSGTYNCTITTYTQYVQSGNGEPYIVEQIVVYDCIFTFTPPSLAPPQSGPDTGGEDPGCYEPHPDFEGFMVPCGSFDPECPCCSLPESQRAACEADEPPCEDLPLKTMEIASPGASGKNGGRYGMTRSSGTQPHHGLDIAAEKGTYVYSPFSGKVSNIDSSFSPGEYKEISYGNFVTVESTDANGNIFYLRYCHLDYDLVEFGDEIEVGQVIGIAGDTGNAQKVTNKHVHIYGAKKDSNGNIIRTNPEDYLKTKWDSSGNISVNPCNN